MIGCTCTAYSYICPESIADLLAVTWDHQGWQVESGAT